MLPSPALPVQRSAPPLNLYAPDEPLLPLPLTPFEKLFVQDDSPGYPIHFFYRLRFTGCMQKEMLQRALEVALARHPLLTAIVHGERGLSWIPAAVPIPEIQWHERNRTDDFPAAAFLDIRKQSGLRLTVIDDVKYSDLVLQFHHAACDAVGAMDFVTDLLTAYANAQAGTNRFPFKPLENNRLRRRGDVPLAGWPLFRWGVRRLANLRSLWRFYRRKPVPVVPHVPLLEATDPPQGFPEACIHHFTRAESAALAKIAKGSELSLNALLVRDLFVALAKWRAANGLPDDAWLRLMVPINMRTPGDRRLPAANVVSTVFLDRPLNAASEPKCLLEGINRFMDDIKRNDLGVGWLLALPLLQRMERAWEKARRSKRKCLYSALLTNVGPVLAGSPLPRADRRLVVGDMTLDEVEVVPAARPLQCLGLAVSNYAGRMSLGLRYQSGVLSEEQARQILDVYVRTVRASFSGEPQVTEAPVACGSPLNDAIDKPSMM
jgi:hypothetical protein